MIIAVSVLLDNHMVAGTRLLIILRRHTIIGTIKGYDESTAYSPKLYIVLRDRKPFRILKSIYMWYDITRIDLRRNQQHYMNQGKGEKKLP